MPTKEFIASFRDRLDGNTQRKFMALCQRKIELDQVKKQTEAELEIIKGELLPLVVMSGEEKLALWDGFNVRRAGGTSASSISAQVLLQKGVSAVVIEAATVPGKSYEYVQIDVPKDVKPKAKAGRR